MQYCCVRLDPNPLLDEVEHGQNYAEAGELNLAIAERKDGSCTEGDLGLFTLGIENARTRYVGNCSFKAGELLFPFRGFVR
jgi:hypothetical protein